jgi:GR25 family glycosyltransferase involved in LPS biosynthesis
MEIDKVFIINLVSRTDRKNKMKKSLKLMGIPNNRIEFIPATTRELKSWKSALKEIGHKESIDKSLHKTVLRKLSSKNQSVVKTTSGEVGNFFSHIRVWNKVSKMKPGNYLILEDDICPTKYWFQKSRDQLFNKIKNDYLFLFLGDCWRSGYEGIGPIYKQGQQSLIRDFTYCLHAYMITPTFGMTIASQCVGQSNALFPLNTPSDDWLPNYLMKYKMPWFIYKKPLIIQYIERDDSDIGASMDDSRFDIDDETQNFKCSEN